MGMMQTHVLGHLRKQLIEQMGQPAAQLVFHRTGWIEGKKDADLEQTRFRQTDLTAGLRLHTMEGFVWVTTKRFEFDIARGHYHGEFHWHDSTEAHEHRTHFGVSDCPTCWNGQPVIFREAECAGRGSERCLVIGRTAAIERARRLLERVAGHDEPVLFMGAPGTGKEYFARRRHEIGRNPSGPFVSVNCGGPSAMPLMGPVGALARAGRGTLFLNDIFALPPASNRRWPRCCRSSSRPCASGATTCPP